MENEKITLGEKIKGLRGAATLENMAKKAGISIAYISALEKGDKTNPSVSVLKALAGAFGTSLDDLAETIEPKKMKRGRKKIKQLRSVI